MRACIIFNPAARGDKAQRFLKHINHISEGAALKPTAGPGGAKSLAAEAVREGFDTIVAAGGDGTLNEVLNGIMETPGGFSTRLATIPLGTVNVFAREIGMPSDPAKAWKLISAGRERLMDVPQATFVTQSGPETRHFIQMAGAGFDARAVEAVSWELKKKVGQLAYVYAGFQSLSGKQAQITVEHPGGSATGELVLIGNGRFYGGSYPIFHAADYGDRILDICVFDKINWLTLPAYGLAFLTGKLFRGQAAQHFQTRELKLTSPTRAALQLEGEPVGQLPAAITLSPQQLRVIVGHTE